MESARRDFLKQMALAGAAVPLLKTAAAAAETPQPGTIKAMGPEKFIDVGGIRTRYYEGGTGTPLVMIHGGQWPATSSADSWAPIFGKLTQRFHVYAFDKLGMGFTDNPKTDADWSIDGIIRHAYGFIKAVGVEQIGRAHV